MNSILLKLSRIKCKLIALFLLFFSYFVYAQQDTVCVRIGQGGYVANTLLMGNQSQKLFSDGAVVVYSASDSTLKGEGNVKLNTSPFIDGTFQIRGNSQARDAGNDDYLTLLDTLDLGYHSRRMGLKIDIGAYEYIADYQLDYFVNLNLECSDTSQVRVNIKNGNPPFNLYWSDGKSEVIDKVPPFLVSRDVVEGSYVLSVEDGYGVVKQYNFSVDKFIPFDADTVVKYPDNATDDNGSITLENMNGMSPFNFLWNTGDISSAISGLSSGYYTVKITDNRNCETRYEFNLANEYEDEESLFISANDDGINDYLVLRKARQYRENKLIIVDPYGRLIREFKNYNSTDNRWDGRSKTGKLLNSGTYYYVLSSNGKTIQKGPVFLRSIE